MARWHDQGLMLLLPTFLLAGACDRQFDFDVPGAAGGSSAGSSSPGQAGSGATQQSGYSEAEECRIRCREHDLVCAERGLVCVECTRHEDCSRDAAFARCDTTLQRCVQCLTELDCPRESACDMASRRCVRTCEAHQSGTLGAAGAAEPGGDDCPTDSLCDEVTGRCAECSSDRDCAGASGGSRCHPSLRICVACLSDADCAGDALHCDPVGFRCVECRDSQDCRSGRCSTERGICC